MENIKSIDRYLRDHNITRPAAIIDFIMNKCDHFIVLGNNNSHNYGPVGTKVTINSRTIVNPDYLSRASSEIRGTDGNDIGIEDLGVVLVMSTIPQFEKKIAEIQVQIETLQEDQYNLQDKIDFMKEHKLEVFNERTYLVTRVTEMLESSDKPIKEKVDIFIKEVLKETV